MQLRIRSHPILSIAIGTMCVALAFETLHAAFGLGGRGLDSFTEDFVYTAVELIAVGVCGARAIMRRQDRAAWALMTVALSAWTVGDLIWTVWLDNVANPPYPSPADAAYLLMYPTMYAALMLLIRARKPQTGLAQWLDGGVVGLAIAAIAAALVFSSVLATVHSRLAAEAVNIAYPAGDLVLLVFVAVACALSGWRPGRLWILLGVGVGVTAVADMIFVYQVASGSYVTGTLLDVMWPASMAVLAVAAWAPVRRSPSRPALAPHTILLTLLAACGALVLLVLAAFTRVTPVAVGLAAVALILASFRGALTYLENVSMLRRSARDALTDSLSGLANRRALMADLEHAVHQSHTGAGFTVVFFDLNGFKGYNDSFGHAAGDALLARLGGELQAVVADHGHAYRLGGDEFCLLLRGRHTVGEHVIAAAAAALVESGSAFTIGVSLGVALIPDDAASATTALQLADERMYINKPDSNRAGRAQASDVLMALLGERAPELRDHVSEVTGLVRAVAADFRLDAEQIDELLRAAELHDVGKLAIPDAILGKPGPLDDAEWRFMRQHPAIGERILSAAPALVPVAKLVRSSHERWDGTGYPDGLKGTEIPLGARILAVCDAFEAMTADRCYRLALDRADAMAKLQQNAGTQFDPAAVRVLCRWLDAAAADPARRSQTGPPAAA